MAPFYPYIYSISPSMNVGVRSCIHPYNTTFTYPTPSSIPEASSNPTINVVTTIAIVAPQPKTYDPDPNNVPDFGPVAGHTFSDQRISIGGILGIAAVVIILFGLLGVCIWRQMYVKPNRKAKELRVRNRIRRREISDYKR
jgi:hypothetical protein